MNEDFTYVVSHYNSRFWPLSAYCWSQLVEYLAKKRTVEQIIARNAYNKHPNHNFCDDLSQDIYVSLMQNKNPEQMRRIFLSGQVQYYITRMATIHIQSTSNQTWNKYRKQTSSSHISDAQLPITYFERLFHQNQHSNQIDEQPYPELKDYSISELKELILSALTATTDDWYNIEISKRHLINGETLTSISKQTKIPLNSVFNTVKKNKLRIKQWLANYIENEL